MIIKPRRELACLYFPYADLQPSPSLLMAALLFDRIYFLEPNFFRPPEARLGERADSGGVPLLLQEIGIFREIGPDLMGFGKNFGLDKPIFDSTLRKEIRASIIADLNNPELNKLIAQYGKLYWRIPNGQFLFWNGLGLLFDIVQNQMNVPVPEILTSRPDYYGQLIERAGYKGAVQSYEDARIRNVSEELMVRVPFIAAEALMVTVSLCACTEFELIPFTDNPLHHQYLQIKLGSLMEKMSSQTDTVSTTLSKGIGYTQVGTKSIEVSLPAIENLTPEKVWSLRENCADELVRFRNEMIKLVYSIESNPWSAEYEHELEKVIETEVRPVVAELEGKIRSLKQKFGIELIEKALVTAPLPFLLNIFTGLPVEWILPASVGAVWLKQTLEYIQKRSELKQNGVSFLLNLR